MAGPKRGMWKGFDEYPSATHPEFTQTEAYLAKEMDPTDANMYGYRDRFRNAPAMTDAEASQAPLQQTMDKFYKLYGKEDALRVLDELNRMAGEDRGVEGYEGAPDPTADPYHQYAARREMNPATAGPDPYTARGFPDHLPDTPKPDKNALMKLLLKGR